MTGQGRVVSAVPVKTRDVVYERAGFRCERCGEDGGHFSLHHRSARRMGGSKDPAKHAPSNLLLLCGSGTAGPVVTGDVYVPTCPRSPDADECTSQTPCDGCPASGSSS